MVRVKSLCENFVLVYVAAAFRRAFAWLQSARFKGALQRCADFKFSHRLLREWRGLRDGRRGKVGGRGLSGEEVKEING